MFLWNVSQISVYVEAQTEHCLCGSPDRALELFGTIFMKWVSMAEQLHTSLRSPCALPSIGLSGLKLAAIGLWSSGNVFSGVINHASHLAVRQTNQGLADARKILPSPMHSTSCEVWCRRNSGLELFFMVRTRPLSSSEGKSQRYSIQ